MQNVIRGAIAAVLGTALVLTVGMTAQAAGSVEASRSFGSVMSFTTAATPTVSGLPRSGGTLTAATGGWTPTPTQFEYQWLANGNPIGGATGSMFVPRTVDAGAGIAVTVTGTRADYPATARTSAATAPVATDLTVLRTTGRGDYIVASETVALAGEQFALGATGESSTFSSTGRTFADLTGGGGLSGPVLLIDASPAGMETSGEVTVYLAGGLNTSTAQAGTVLGRSGRWVLLTVPSGCVPAAVLTRIDDLSASRVVLVGAFEPSIAKFVSCETTAASAPAPSPVPAPVPVPVTSPGETNTGYPVGTPLVVHNGDLKVTAPGTVIDGLDVRGRIIVSAANVTIRNSIVRGPTVGWTASSALITATAGFPNLVISDTELSPTIKSGWVNGILGNNFSATRLNIHDVIDAVHITGDNVTVTASWLHDNLHYEVDPNQNGTPSHDDSIQIQGGRNISITNNTMSGAANAALQITQDRSIVSSVTFSGNAADGGGCTVNVAEKGKGSIVGIVANNNTFGRTTTVANCAMIAPSTTIISAQNNFYTDGRPATVRRG